MIGYVVSLLLFLWLYSMFHSLNHRNKRISCAPIHGYRSLLEPTLLLQARFTSNAPELIRSGYEKFKDRPFVVRRYDADITILPHKYVAELCSAPASKMSAVKVQVANLVHRWTYSSFIEHSDLHFRVVEKKLIPQLPKYIYAATKEMEHAWLTNVPKPQDWTEVDIQHIIRTLVSQMSSRIFLGLPTCRDPKWLNLALSFPADVNTTAFTLRAFPPLMHPIIARLIPARYRVKRKIDLATEIIRPLISKECERKDKGDDGGDDTLLDWMMSNGDDKETRVGEMATRQCLLALASTHATSMAAANALFDLCAHPEWFAVLEDEINDTLRDRGFLKSEKDARGWLSSLEKMDSFLVESQRLHPPILLSPQREAMVPFILKDGTCIPKGCRVAWAASSHLNDPHVTPNPEVFDPMRSYRKRYSSDQRSKHLAGQTSIDNLTFGYGRLACPGRAFAAAEVKVLLVKFLSEFDFKFPKGISMLHYKSADEIVFPDPKARVLMRKKLRRETQA